MKDCERTCCPKSCRCPATDELRDPLPVTEQAYIVAEREGLRMDEEGGPA